MKVIITEQTRNRYKKRPGETEAEYVNRVSRYRAASKYQKANIRNIKFGLNKKTEKELIDFYDCIPDIYGISKTAFFKQIMITEYEKYSEEIKKIINDRNSQSE